jgi:hypothetical protein
MKSDMYCNECRCADFDDSDESGMPKCKNPKSENYGKGVDASTVCNTPCLAEEK